ncbi:GNAT family N-acetyltransferase [Arthrobacter cryoconiti]|uniref:GNAT family N-acetyltransferase n=1 Tax=Arthrobacter cryoconiti TaxID=748907 RepID=A0ABV8QWN0_9MICC|nr:N-acetyltransferase [Arthrobacter cryoconiti]MCC9068869.1 GNAT family N-acetyltransferase [Arthrobacter cryoconiti]
MLIREATADDWSGIWAVVEPVVRAGESYTFPVNSSEAIMRQIWLPENAALTAVPVGHVEPAAKDTSVSSRPSRTFVVTEETGGASAPMVVATAQLHPNFPAAGSHIANASFMVHPDHEDKGYGRLLAHHVLNAAFADNYRGILFNAVVESNEGAIHLWESLGFEIMATIPGAFDHPSLGPVALHIMFKPLDG